jgi:hypothetical protein
MESYGFGQFLWLRNGQSAATVSSVSGWSHRPKILNGVGLFVVFLFVRFCHLSLTLSNGIVFHPWLLHIMMMGIGMEWKEWNGDTFYAASGVL